jgi:hypothetical protein
MEEQQEPSSSSAYVIEPTESGLWVGKSKAAAAAATPEPREDAKNTSVKEESTTNQTEELSMEDQELPAFQRSRLRNLVDGSEDCL